MKTRPFHILALLLLLSISLSLSAQQKPTQFLKIGDTLPDIDIQYTQNGKLQKINTQSLRGKLVILDFWNIWCSVCISAMPEMARLQNQFPEEVKIFAVTNNTPQQIADQFRKIAERQGKHTPIQGIPAALSSVTSDTVLHRLFPHRAVPHHIWINGEGKICYITSGGDTNEENIRDVLKNKSLNVVEKIDTGKFDFDVPLYLEGKGRQLKNLKYYSMLFKQAREFSNSRIIWQRDTLQKTYRLSCYNFTLFDLYQQATKDTYQRTFFSPKRIMLEVADTTNFYWPKDQSKAGRWALENLYCYDMRIPLKDSTSAGKMMFEDLNRYLPYRVSIEKRRKKCLALVRTGKKDHSKPENKTSGALVGKNRKTFKMENEPLSSLIYNGLGAYAGRSPLPLVDATNFKGKVSLNFTDKLDLEAIRKDLQQAGFDLIEQTLDIDMLVITDR